MMAKGILLTATFMYCSALNAQQAIKSIYLNQVGYYTVAPKTAAVSGATGKNFFILHAVSADTVFKGRLEDERASLNSSLRVSIARFTSLQKEGRYVLTV